MTSTYGAVGIAGGVVFQERLQVVENLAGSVLFHLLFLFVHPGLHFLSGDAFGVRSQVFADVIQINEVSCLESESQFHLLGDPRSAIPHAMELGRGSRTCSDGTMQQLCPGFLGTAQNRQTRSEHGSHRTRFMSQAQTRFRPFHLARLTPIDLRFAFAWRRYLHLWNHAPIQFRDPLRHPRPFRHLRLQQRIFPHRFCMRFCLRAHCTDGHLDSVMFLQFMGGSGKWEGTLRSEEHTSELQSHSDLVCRLLLEKKKEKNKKKGWPKTKIEEEKTGRTKAIREPEN